MHDFIILLTACVAPKGMPSTVLADEDTRKKHYVDAIRYYREKTPFYIVFVDNSNVDLSSCFENNAKIEFINFMGADYDKKLGKGFGEGEIIEYALNKSSVINNWKTLPIIKISGRHIVKNLTEILTLTDLLVNKAKPFIAAHINTKAQSVISDMFVAHPKFYSDYLIKNTHLIDESKGYWFEHALYSAVNQAYKGGVKVVNLPLGINQDGYSGSTGKKFERPKIKDHIKSIVKSVLYKLNIYHP